MAELFDRAHFAHMTGNDAALQAEIIALFKGQMPLWTAALASSTPGWRDAAHTVKGSARGIGLWQLADACEAAERAPDGEPAFNALARLHDALGEAVRALDEAPH